MAKTRSYRVLPTGPFLAAINANLPSDTNPFATMADLSSFIAPVHVANYSALPDPTTVPGAFYYADASQGTKWLPGSLGGTYYPSGFYYSDGSATWVYSDSPGNATQPTVDAGVNNDQFITPLTLTNSSQLADAKVRANHTGTQLSSTISDFASTVLATLLSGLSLTTSQVIAPTDSILQAFGYLQAQITALSIVPSLNNYKLIQSLSDFPTPVAGVITLLNNYTYQINGIINIGTNRIVVGTSNTIFGLDISDDRIIGTGAVSLITNTNQDLTIENVTLINPTVGSTTYNFTGTTNKVRLKDVAYGGCASLGSIEVGILLVLEKSVFSQNTTGLIITGNSVSSDLVIADNYIVADNLGSFSWLNINSGNFGIVDINRNVLNIEAGQTGITVGGGVTIQTKGTLGANNFNGAGTYLSGFSHLSTAWLFTGNTGIANRQREFFVSVNDMSGVALTSPATAAAAISFFSTTGSRFLTLRGGNNQDDGLSFGMQVPTDYFSGGRFDINLTTDISILNIKLFMGIAKVPVGDNYGTLDETGLNVVFGGVALLGNRIEVSINPITTTFAGGDVFVIKLWRDPDDVQDTALAVACYISSIQFVYNSI